MMIVRSEIFFIGIFHPPVWSSYISHLVPAAQYSQQYKTSNTPESCHQAVGNRTIPRGSENTVWNTPAIMLATMLDIIV